MCNSSTVCRRMERGLGWEKTHYSLLCFDEIHNTCISSLAGFYGEILGCSSTVETAFVKSHFQLSWEILPWLVEHIAQVARFR